MVIAFLPQGSPISEAVTKLLILSEEGKEIDIQRLAREHELTTGEQSEEELLRFHHKLVLVHLFPNGNGRHARLMTDILLEEVLKQKPFNWSLQAIVDEDKVRDAYLKALRKADQGDYSLLLKFIHS